MGRKKGKQSGDFLSKSQFALHRHTLYVDHAAEANRYRSSNAALGSSSSSSSSSSRHTLGRGLGFRNNDNGYWHANTAYGGGDKWSTLFSSSSSSSTQTNHNSSAYSLARHHNHHSIPGTAAYSSSSTTSGGENVHHRRTTSTTTLLGLSRLRSLLEERRVEDRLYDREHRLRLQRSRLLRMENNGATTTTTSSSSDKVKVMHADNSSMGNRILLFDQLRKDRHEPGWLLSHQHHHHQETKQQTTVPSQQPSDGSKASMLHNNNVPSLQILAAQKLGPMLPLYCTACGAEFVGRSLKSISAKILSELTIALASANSTTTNNNNLGEDEEDYWPSSPLMTNGVVRAIMHSSIATGIVVRGGNFGSPSPYVHSVNDREGSAGDNSIIYQNDDGKLLNDDGLSSLCPRILPANNRGRYYARNNDDEDDVSSSCAEEDHSSWEQWEIHDFDMGLNSRMLGYFHLKRLELIDVPLMQDLPTSMCSGGGITVQALWTLLRSCSGITHLSLSGCFGNWEDADMSVVDDLSVFLGGNQSVSSFSDCIDKLGKRLGNNTDVGENIILPYLNFHHTFEESTDERNSIPAINSVLPDLTVLDVSHCGWVTPDMIIRLSLNSWKKCFDSVSDGGKNQCGWEGAAENMDVGRKSAHVYPTVRHVNIRGCTRLLSGSTSQPSSMEEWRRYGLFEGIEISTDRQVRM